MNEKRLCGLCGNPYDEISEKIADAYEKTDKIKRCHQVLSDYDEVMSQIEREHVIAVGDAEGNCMMIFKGSPEKFHAIQQYIQKMNSGDV